jgi:hypothetical protein
MRRQLLLFVTPLALVCTASATAIVKHVPAHTKKQAEVNVLRVVATTPKVRRLPSLVNPRTHLLRDNTEAMCDGRGRQPAPNRYARFVCVVRPHSHTARQGLYVSYRVLSRGRFRIHWLAYRKR